MKRVETLTLNFLRKFYFPNPCVIISLNPGGHLGVIESEGFHIGEYVGQLKT